MPLTHTIAPLLGLPASVTIVVIKLAAVGAGLIAFKVAWEAVEYFAAKAEHHSFRTRLKAFRGRQRMTAVILFSIIWALIGAGVWRWAAGWPQTPVTEVAADKPTVIQQPAVTDPPVAEPTRPVVALRDEGAYIVVRNTGAPATFRARLVAVHGAGFPSVAEGEHFEGMWESTRTDKTEIATGDADRLMLGRMPGDTDPKMTPFHFYDLATGQMGSRYARQTPGQGVPSLYLDLTLSSIPALAGGPKSYEITVGKGRVDFLKEKPSQP
jgi:hypothetical protein